MFKHRGEIVRVPPSKQRNCTLFSLKSFVPNGPVFDIGAGNGYVSLALEHSGVETVVVEPGARGARNAKTRGLGTVIHAALEDCEFQDQTIPAFGLFDVLEHVQNDSEFLNSLHCQLLPKGYVYVTVPAYNFLWSIEDDYAQHHRRYTVRTLTKTLESTGFAVKYCSYFFCASCASRFRYSIYTESAMDAPLHRHTFDRTGPRRARRDHNVSSGTQLGLRVAADRKKKVLANR